MAKYKFRSVPILPVGGITHDGPATPEQISLYLLVTGSLSQSATATVRYKKTSGITWTTGHPLLRIHPASSATPAVGTVVDAFAWPIIDLETGTAYDVEATITEGVVVNVKTASFTTRALPAVAGTPNKTIANGSSNSTIQTAFNALNPGDVIEFAAGTYNVSGLILNRSGTSGSPIYIRGASRSGVILTNSSRVLRIHDASDVIIENLTMTGSGVDSGTSASSSGIEFYDGTPDQTRVTIREVTMTGVDRAIGVFADVHQCLVYDCTFTGNNVWTSAFVNTNTTWNDDGINLGGTGNCAFNNSLTGFGDSLAYAASSSGVTLTNSIGVHFYRNEIHNSCDDMTEGDHSHRNNTFYDNRCHNSMTFLSFDPLYGGPFLACRNIAINVGRQPFKWNSANSGQFVYNNTIIETTMKNWVDGAFTAEAGWYQPNSGSQVYFGYRNNLLVYRGSGSQTIRLDNPTYNQLDFTHNSWYPNGVFQWPQGTFANLAAAYAGLAATTPVFSEETKRHEQDTITISNPWTDTITLGANYLTEVTTVYTPVLTAATAPKNTGVVIPNVTDMYTGALPDRGASIEGRTMATFGDRSIPPPAPDTEAPTAPTNLTATVISDVRIDLSWTASTDNVAVTGYQLERCTGAACTGFGQIAAPTASPYSNTGLTAGTLYRYRIRATDAANNLSAYSSIVQATTSGSPPVSAMATLAASMNAGEWAELVTTNMTVFDQPGSDGHIISYAFNAGWDPVNRKFLYCGNDHIDGNAAQGLRFVSYDEVTNTWTNHTAPPFSVAGATMHGYGHNTCDPTTGTFYRRAGNTGFAWSKYDVASSVWTSLPTNSAGEYAGGGYAACDFFIERGGFIYAQGGEFGGGSVYFYNVTTGIWSQIGNNLAPMSGGTWTSGCYNPVRQVYCFGQGGTGGWYKMLSTGGPVQMANPPISFYNGTGLGAVIVADPVSGKFIILSVGVRTLYTYEVNTDTWATPSSTNKPNLSGLSVIGAPISNYGVMMFVIANSNTRKVYLYKHA